MRPPYSLRIPKPHRRGRFRVDRAPVEVEDHTNINMRTKEQRLRFETTDEERQARIRMPQLKFLTSSKETDQ